MVQARGVTPVLAVLRALGGFPYTWCPSRQTEGVRVSWVAAAWSTLVVSVMMIFCVASVTTHYTLHLGARHVMRHLLITYWYLLVMVLYLYLAMRAHRLARVLRLLAAAGVSVWRRSWGLEDAPVMAAVAVFLTGTCLSISFTDISTSHPVGDVLRLMADRTADLTITVLLTVFYALVKLLSVEMEDTVAALAYATTTALGRGVSGSEWHTPDTSTQRPLSHSHHSITNTQHPQTPQQHKFRNSLITTTTTQEHAFQSPSPSGRRSKHPAAALLPHVSPVLHLLALDDVLREVVGYASPPLLLLLLNAAASTTMFLYSAIATSSAYYMGFISVLVARMVQIVLIPDPMTRKREECRRLLSGLRLQHPDRTTMRQVAQAEEVLAGGSHFTLCGLFTLDRQTFLTVSSFVVTYLVITLQFEMSSDSSDHRASVCPANTTSE
ncbi:uncharacterized protein LOC127001466 [Eriocheir sinensis]|uniref:uncharacterized protein LOC127001466 n=1 Tax=Eriocheir sinensis TaxID=95602 RepID=UPI0021C5D3E4|nr:uncharacterized protein LOC127001466 [Eriocheir sinensis]